MKVVPMEVTYVDHMGSDLSVVNSARVSFNKSVSEFSEKDEGLVKYLARNNHWTPFGHATACFRVKAPIFVARQLVKHQVGLVWNEVSRRYVDDKPEFWLPDVFHKRPDGNIKQGAGEVMERTDFEERLAKTDTLLANLAYIGRISAGMAPEEARMFLPLNTMTEWIWTGSLAAWARVCKLRLDPHAQAATRTIAEKIDVEMAKLFPVSWNALME